MSKSGTLGIFTIIAIVLATLKLAGVIALSWWVILGIFVFPVFFILAVVCFIAIFSLIALAVAHLTDVAHRRQMRK